MKQKIATLLSLLLGSILCSTGAWAKPTLPAQAPIEQGLMPAPLVLDEQPSAMFWDTDGIVNSIAYSHDGRTAYIGGKFSHVQSEREGGFIFDRTSGEFDRSTPTPRIDGAIEVVVSDGQGGWYLGGSITAVNESSCSGLAHLRSDNSPNPNLAPTINGSVLALYLDATGHILYLGGDFTEVNGLARDRIAAIDSITGELLPFNPGADGVVRAFAYDPESALLYVGGDFSQIHGQPRLSLAAIDTVSGVPTEQVLDVRGSSSSARINSIALDRVHNQLFIGGEFTYLGSDWRSRPDLAAIDLSTGEPTEWIPRPGGRFTGHSPISALELDEQSGILYVGGEFVRFDMGGVSIPRRSVAAFHTASGAIADFDPGTDVCGDSNCIFDPVVKDLALDPSTQTLFLGGRFSRIDYQSHYRVAALDSVTGQVKPWNSDLGDDLSNGFVDEVRALSISPNNNRIFVGGINLQIRTPRENLAALDTTTGQPTPFRHDVPRSGSPSDPIYSLIVDDGTLYLGGDFEEVAGEARRSLAAINLDSNQLTSWDPNRDAVGVIQILSMSLDSDRDTLYVGGRFSNLGVGFGYVRRKIAAIDTRTGAVTPWTVAGYSGIGGGCCALNTPAVETLYLHQPTNTLYLGGSFDLVGNQARSRLAAVDSISGAVLPWNPGADSDVHILTLDPATNLLYAGGAFSQIGGYSRNKIAAINATTGEVASWNANIQGGYSNIGIRGLALDTQNRRLFIGGDYDDLGGQAHSNLAAIDLNSLQVAPWYPSLRIDETSRVKALTFNPIRKQLYVAGRFGEPALEEVDGDSKSYFAVFNAPDQAPTADFNQDSSVDVTDIFAFLSAFFAGDMRADIDRNGTVEVPDIFAFLSLYFAH